MTERIHRWWWILLFIGPVVLFGPMILKGESLFWGTPMLQFVPWRSLALDMIKAGHLPLWNPYLGMGAPLWANYQTAILYPPNWLYFLTGPAWGQAIVVLLHLVWAGAGMVYLMRLFKVSFEAQITAALAFSLSGYLVSRAGFLSINAAVAWLPWLIFAVERMNHSLQNDDGKPNQSTIILALVLAMQWLAGHAQTAWYSLVLAGLWVLWRSLSYAGRRRTVELWLRFFVGGLLAACLAAPQLLPTLEYLAHSYRAGSLDAAFALTYSLWPWRLMGLVAPDLFGSPVHGDYWGYGNYWEDAIYIGVLPLILVAIALRRLRGSRSPHGPLLSFLGWVSVGALLLALGDNTPLFPFLFRHVPTFNLFQAPTRWTILAVFNLSILAGLGLEVWKAPQGRSLYWSRLFTAGAGVIGLAAWLGATFVTETEPTFVRAFALAGLWFFLAGLLALTMDKLPPRIWRAAILMVIVVDLVIAGWGLNPSVPTQVYETKMAIVPGSVDQRVYMPADLEYSLTYERYFTFDSFMSETSWSDVIQYGIPNTNIFSGILSANNFDPIRPERYELWLNGVENLPQDLRAAHLRNSGVGWIAQATDDREVRYQALPESQRVYMVPEALSVSSFDEALALVFSSSFDPHRQVVVEGETQPGQSVDSVSALELRWITTEDPNRVSLQVASESGGWLVLADSWYPGWSVTIDDQNAPLLPANAAFKAVWLPSGEHAVIFYYRPTSLILGAVLFVTAATAVIIFRKSWRN